jgi:hypothetical protein
LGWTVEWSQKLKRVFHHYRQWEDYWAGMYALPSKTDEPLRIKSSAMLLSKPSHFFGVALRMIQEWPVTTEHHLSNRSRNRQAWIGQATCCFAFETPEHQTKEAWHRLSERQQTLANAEADNIIAIWESTIQCPNQV